MTRCVRCESNRNRCTKRCAGFTLIEALVAMTLIAVALMACIKAAGTLNQRQDEMLQRQYAQWSARSTAHWLRVAGVFPDAPQTIQTSCNQGKFQLVCSLQVSNTPNPNFRRIEIQVRNANNSNHELAHLVVFLASTP